MSSEIDIGYNDLCCFSNMSRKNTNIYFVSLTVGLFLINHNIKQLNGQYIFPIIHAGYIWTLHLSECMNKSDGMWEERKAKRMRATV